MVENKDRKCDHGHLFPVLRKSGKKHQMNGTSVGWGDQGGICLLGQDPRAPCPAGNSGEPSKEGNTAFSLSLLPTPGLGGDTGPQGIPGWFPVGLVQQLERRWRRPRGWGLQVGRGLFAFMKKICGKDLAL